MRFGSKPLKLQDVNRLAQDLADQRRFCDLWLCFSCGRSVGGVCQSAFWLCDVMYTYISYNILYTYMSNYVYMYMSVSRNGVYKIYDHICMLHFRESYPESCPRIIPANHTSETYLRISKGGRNIPRNIPPNHTSETYLESYPLMQHALLGTEFSEKAIYTYIYRPGN